MIRVVARGVEDGDTDDAVSVDCLSGVRVWAGMWKRGRNEPFGCHRSQRNFMVGGMRG